MPDLSKSAGILVRFTDDRNKAEILGTWNEWASMLWDGKRWIGREVLKLAGLTTIYTGRQMDWFHSQFQNPESTYSKKRRL